jgi:SHS family lactate transporter-like MFS transporter
MPDILRQQRQVVTACYLGWTLDAFDFFIMAFALDPVAHEFGVTRTTVTWAITLTLGLRPVGALLFGRLADRFGRRPTLMANVLVYSFLELASGFAPNLGSFLLLRALYGVAMGGEWGVGAALTMESIPARWRGPVSGLLQAGYPTGFLLATLLNWAALDIVGWRGLFMLGALPALLVLYIRRSVPESPDWVAGKTTRAHTKLLPVLRQHARLTIYAVVMMAAFNFFSHGTQDLYKSFLATERHLSLQASTSVLIFMNLAAIAGGFVCAALSQRIGRRYAIVIASVLALPIIPLWAFSVSPVWIGIGAVLMQLCVQGAWGVIPAHLNELSPASVRGTFPGVTYQLGNLVAAANATLQSGMGDRYFGGDITWPLAIVVGIVAVVIAVLVGFGPEARGVRMGREASLAPFATD